MKEYKLESFIYYSKMTLNKNHLIDKSHEEIQTVLEEHSAKGWILSSTDAFNFGAAAYFYLYFERERKIS